MERQICNQNNKSTETVKYDRWIVDYDSIRTPQTIRRNSLKPLTVSSKFCVNNDKQLVVFRTPKSQPENADCGTHFLLNDLITCNGCEVDTSPTDYSLLGGHDNCETVTYQYSARRSKIETLGPTHVIKQTELAPTTNREIKSIAWLDSIKDKTEKTNQQKKTKAVLLRCKTDVDETHEVQGYSTEIKSNYCFYTHVNTNGLKRSKTIMGNTFCSDLLSNIKIKSKSHDNQVHTFQGLVRTDIPAYKKNTETPSDNIVRSTKMLIDPNTAVRYGYRGDNKVKCEIFSWELAGYSSSSTTSATAFTGPELLSGMKGIQRPAHMDDLVASNISAFEKDLQQTQHLEAGNRRQLFKTRPCSLVEKASFDSDDGRVLNTSFQAKPSWHRKNGIQSSLIRGEQLLIQRTTGSTSSQGSGDLIAMGTLWNPGNNVSCNTTSKDSISGQTIGISDNHSFINKSLALGPQNTNGSSSNSNNNTINSHRKPANLRMNHNSSVSGISNTMFGLQLGINGNNSIRESKCIADPKYQDPLYGATASFQQRLMELASLEADTIRWERNKKVKKKSKPDKD